MNSLRSAWTPFLAGPTDSLLGRRKEKRKLDTANPGRDILSRGLVQDTGQFSGASSYPSSVLFEPCHLHGAFYRHTHWVKTPNVGAAQ